MIPGKFDYVRPGSLDEAVRALRQVAFDRGAVHDPFALDVLAVDRAGVSDRA